MFFFLFYYYFGWLITKIVSEPLTADNLRSMYIKVPHVSLQDSVKHVPIVGATTPLSCIAGSLAAAYPTKGLTKEEAAVIRSYTAECGIYRTLNAALRTRQLMQIQPWFSYLKHFHNALIKIPPRKGPYCRGIAGDYHKEYPVSSTVVWWGISSLSSSDTVCFNFLKSHASSTGGFINGTLFKVKSLSAREIADFSAFPSEAESILLPATKFKVITNIPSATHSGLYNITLEEIDIVPAITDKTTSTVKIVTSTTIIKTTTKMHTTTTVGIATKPSFIPKTTATSMKTTTTTMKTTTTTMKTATTTTKKSTKLTLKPINIHKPRPQISFAMAHIEKSNSNKQIIMIAICFIYIFTMSIRL